MSTMRENTKALLSARRSLELALLAEIKNWEATTGLCISGVHLKTCSLPSRSTSTESTADVRVEVLL